MRRALARSTALACFFSSTLALGPADVLAQSNLEKLSQFKTTGVTEFTIIPQDDQRAEQLRANLSRIKLPTGFKIDLYAIVPDARHIAVAPQGTVVFVGTKKTDVWSVSDRDRNRIADEVKRFAPSIDFVVPNGVCFSRDGFLYVVEQNRVLQFPAAEFFYESPDVAAFEVIKQGDLIPKEEESYNHTARVCRVGPDGKLYISLGQPFNVSPPEKLELYSEVGIGGIIRINTDGTGREVVARGIRNSVGHDFNPANGELWFTDNQVDGMGDDIPPGELNRLTSNGQHFGHPWYGGGEIRTNEYKDQEVTVEVTMPEVEMDAHAADLGMTFYNGRSFPEKYQGGIFSAQHGSWNRTTPVGARVMFTALNEEGGAASTEVFAEGWLDPQTGEYLGRPVDVAQLPDGSILVSDDFAGVLYRISYGD